MPDRTVRRALEIANLDGRLSLLGPNNAKGRAEAHFWLHTAEIIFKERVDMHIVAQPLAVTWLKDALSGKQADDIHDIRAD